MPDPVGGREAEREAVGRALAEYHDGDQDDWTTWRRSADLAIDALDAVRSSGSAAQNQEDYWRHRAERNAEAYDRLEAEAARSPQDEDPRIHVLENELRIAREKVEVWEREFHRLAARSPQDEDHEP